MPAEKTKLRAVSFDNGVSETRPKRASRRDEGVCQICFGTGMEIVEGRGAKPCVCRLTKASEQSVDRVRIPKRYAKCDLTNFFPANDSQRLAKNWAEKLISEYHPEYEPNGILYMGDCGVGKTHLAVAILKGLSSRGFNGLFYEFGALLKEIQDSYNANTRESELGVLAPVFNAEILVLDELGSSKPTSWVQDTLGQIINNRYNSKRFTIFTTNYFDDCDDPRKESLGDRITARVRSRLYQMSKTVVINGDDYRRMFDRRAIVKR